MAQALRLLLSNHAVMNLIAVIIYNESIYKYQGLPGGTYYVAFSQIATNKQQTTTLQ